MVTVETIGRIRRAFWVDKKPIRQIVRELRISRQTVRKAIRGSSVEFRYERQVQPQPRLGAYVARLDGLLEANSKRPARERLTARRLFELLRAEGYDGAYDDGSLRIFLLAVNPGKGRITEPTAATHVVAGTGLHPPNETLPG